MRKNILWALVVVSATLIQGTWLDAIRIAGVIPDLTLLLVVYFAVASGEERAMYTGVIGGLFQDVARTTSIGHNVLCLVVVGYAAGRLGHRLVTEHPAVKAGLVFCAALVHGLLYSALLYLAQPHLAELGDVVGRVVPSAFYTAIVTPIVFFVLDLIFREAPPLDRSMG